MHPFLKIQTERIGALIIPLFLVLLSGSFAYGDVVPLPDVSPSWKLYGVHFTTPDEGWAVEEDTASQRRYLLLYSEDTWTSVPVPLPNVGPNWELYGVHFTTPDEGWVVGEDTANQTGVVLHYLDGIWTSVAVPEPATMVLLGSGLIGLIGLGRRLRK